MMRKLIAIIQVLFGYFLMYSILKIILFFLSLSLILFIFFILMILLKITPHPTSHQNPFAFGLDFRFSN